MFKFELESPEGPALASEVAASNGLNCIVESMNYRSAASATKEIRQFASSARSNHNNLFHNFTNLLRRTTPQLLDKSRFLNAFLCSTLKFWVIVIPQ